VSKSIDSTDVSVKNPRHYQECCWTKWTRDGRGWRTTCDERRGLWRSITCFKGSSRRRFEEY